MWDLCTLYAGSKAEFGEDKQFVEEIFNGNATCEVGDNWSLHVGGRRAYCTRSCSRRMTENTGTAFRNRRERVLPGSATETASFLRGNDRSNDVRLPSSKWTQ